MVDWTKVGQAVAILVPTVAIGFFAVRDNKKKIVRHAVNRALRNYEREVVERLGGAENIRDIVGMIPGDWRVTRAPGHVFVANERGVILDVNTGNLRDYGEGVYERYTSR